MSSPSKPRDHEMIALYRPSCRQLFVVFFGGAEVAMDLEEFLEQAGLSDRNIIAFRDERLTWFMGEFSAEIPGADALAAYLGRIQALLGVEETYVVGLGRGGWAALHYARQVGAIAAWALAPTPPGPGHAAHGVSAPAEGASFADGGGPEYRVYFEAEREDRSFARSLGNLPGVRLHAIPGGAGCLLTRLNQLGELPVMFPAKTLHERP